MEQILRGSFGANSNLIKLHRKQRTIRNCTLLVSLKNGPFAREARNYSCLRTIRSRQPLLVRASPLVVPNCGIGMFIAKLVKGVLKVRYLVLGGAVTGGITFQQKYEEWKSKLPNLKWLDEYLPDSKQWDNMRVSLIAIKDKVKDNVEMDPRLKQLIEAKYKNYKEWFDNRLDQALEAAERANIESHEKSSKSSRIYFMETAPMKVIKHMERFGKTSVGVQPARLAECPG